jgi:hypothetical protein
LVYFLASWYIFWSIGKFYGILVHFTYNWYIFHVLVSCAKKNLATLSEFRADKVGRNGTKNFWFVLSRDFSRDAKNREMEFANFERWRTPILRIRQREGIRQFRTSEGWN